MSDYIHILKVRMGPEQPWINIPAITGVGIESMEYLPDSHKIRVELTDGTTVTLDALADAYDDVNALIGEVEAAEAVRESSEAGRVTAEAGRVSAEAGRASAETSRATAETARASAETARASAETTRQSKETARQTAETARAAAESGRATAETARATAESGRVSAETGRVSAEAGRASAESGRVAAETEREENEIRTVTASVDANTGTPSVNVTKSGNTLALAFHNLKGQPGEVTQAEFDALAGTVSAQSSQIAQLDSLKADKTALTAEVARLTAVNARQDKSIEFLSDAIIGVQAKKVTDTAEAYQKSITAYPQFSARMADVKSIGGKTWVKNQLDSFTSVFINSSARNFFAITSIDNGYRATCITDYTGTLQFITRDSAIQEMFKFGNKYLIRIYVKGSKNISENVIRFGIFPIEWTDYFPLTTSPKLISGVQQISGTFSEYNLYINTATYNVGDYVEITYRETIDLSQWFNGDSTILDSITTPEDAYALGVPRTYIPYNAGEVISANCKATVSRGFNLFNKALATANKRLVWDTGNLMDASGCSTSDYIPIKQSTAYYFKNISGNDQIGGYSICWYDENKTFISSSAGPASGQAASGTRTSVANAKYVRFYYFTTNENTVCMNESSTIDGTYKPYFTPQSMSIPTALRTAHPLRSAGTVHDSLTFSMVNGALKAEHTQNVGTRAYQEGDESDTTVITDGTTTFYPLTTAVITDVTSFFPSGFNSILTVEDGGSLTFEQSETEFAIPNSEDIYYVKVQEETA